MIHNVQLSHEQLSLLRVFIMNYRVKWAKNNTSLPLHIVDFLDSTDYQLRCTNSPKETMYNSPTICEE